MKDRISAVADLLCPRVVVHVGASESGIYPSDIFKSLAASQVTLYAVNPRRDRVFGHPCFASLAKIPDRAAGEGKADLAVITVPASAVPGVLSDCADAGIRQAVVISSGFAEAGAEGRSLQARIEALGDRIRVLGPNCAGFANVADNVIAARLYSRATPGGISFVSQSGALMMALHGAFAELGAGLRSVVSVGNQAGFRLPDFLSHFASDPGSKVVAAFIEGVPDGGEFVEAARECLVSGKPVVAIKSGRTELGRRLAATHTAALAGEGRVFEAVCRQHGIILVDDIEDMVATSLVASAAADSTLERIAWITQSGGLGSLAGDLAKSAGIEPLPFPAGFGSLLNPVDVGGDRMRGNAVRETLCPFLSHPEIDAAVILFAKNPNRDVEIETARSVIAARDEFGKPIVVIWVGPAMSAAGKEAGGEYSLQVLRMAGIPVFGSPGPAVRALGRLVAWRRFRNEWIAAGLGRGLGRELPARAVSSGRVDIADRDATSSDGGGLLGYEETASLLEKAGIPVVRSAFVPAIPRRDDGGTVLDSREDSALAGTVLDSEAESSLAVRTAEAATRLLAPNAAISGSKTEPGNGGTVVLKLLAPGFSHKSDAGLVALNLDSREAVRAAALGMLSRIPRALSPEGFLVQPMVRGGREVFIGAQVDAQFGPVVAFGPGGILVELLGGVDFLRPPFTREEAALFVKRNAAWPILKGVRGSKPADMDTILDTLVNLGNYMLADAGKIRSVDLNPFVVFNEGSGGFALDARIMEAIG